LEIVIEGSFRQDIVDFHPQKLGTLLTKLNNKEKEMGK
jgi:hypothetical protein